METVKDIKLFKDRYFRNEWEETFGSYDIEFIGDKARVIRNSIFGEPKKSRLNKIRWMGSIGNSVSKYDMYHIIVNGHDVYFKRFVLRKTN